MACFLRLLLRFPAGVQNKTGSIFQRGEASVPTAQMTTDMITENTTAINENTDEMIGASTADSKKKSQKKKKTKKEMLNDLRNACEGMSLIDLASMVAEMHKRRMDQMRDMAETNRKYRAVIKILQTKMENQKVGNIDICGKKEILLCEKRRHCMITEQFLRDGIDEFLSDKGDNNNNDALNVISSNLTEHVMKRRKRGKVTKTIVVRAVRRKVSNKNLGGAENNPDNQANNQETQQEAPGGPTNDAKNAEVPNPPAQENDNTAAEKEIIRDATHI